MKLSHRAKFAIAGALFVTLGGKLASLRPAPTADAPLFTERAERLLRAHGLATRTEQHPFGAVTYAQAGPCRMLVADYLPHGTLRAPLSMLAQPIGSMNYIWQGDLLDNPPKIMPLASFFLERELRRIGFTPTRQPLIAAAASSACEVEAIDWNALASLPS